jgi:hypothetical protein
MSALSQGSFLSRNSWTGCTQQTVRMESFQHLQVHLPDVHGPHLLSNLFQVAPEVGLAADCAHCQVGLFDRFALSYLA